MSFNQRWWLSFGILCLGTSCGPASEDVQQSLAPVVHSQELGDGVLLQFGTTGTDRPSAVTQAPDGSLYLVGNTDGALGEPSEQSAGQDIFIAKLASNLLFTWAHQLGSRGDDSAWDVVAASDGSAYVVGLTSDSMPGQMTAGGSDIFATRYDANGNRAWIFQRGTAGEDYALSATLRPNDNLLMAGAAQNAENYDFDVVMDELNLSGQPVGRAAFGSSNFANDRGEGVCTRADGASWVVGSTQGSMGSNTAAGSTDVFVRQLDGSFATLWTRQKGTPDIDAALEVARDGSDRIYVLAMSYSNLETGQSENDGIPNAFLMRYDANNGDLKWVKRIGAANKMSLATGLVVDAQGYAYVAGWTTGQMTLDANHGGTDAFVAKFDRYGNRVRAWQWGTSADDDARDIVLTSATTAVAVGTTSGELAGPGSNSGGQDVFAVKFATTP
ncbi:hypothetical protein DRW03_25995 [Corallococcus sp. H22C18031201]|uniref:SBBP repeat-containing protein n=1 Tax=Citreicoccus inhibens TaxID=2849499 RepID=UPI000E74552F|nr:SBBP repeat-containing protein [Citreicoccus inhibens]MBU8898128.1 SBBP repeat-containing protein [Citreicoccus inhibens]RJS18013.1 hypothetical protein DRW03_25995 [Corallococcus sp. H22C18031201]